MKRRRGLPTDPDHPMPTVASSPQWAIIREIDFRIVPHPDGDLLEFFYSRYSHDQPIGITGLEPLLKQIANPTYQFTGGPANPTKPFSSKLSLNSKERLTYIIFKLAPRGWSYSDTLPPFRIGSSGYAAAAYYNATRFSDRVAHFISDGPKAAAHGSYPHPFNIYVQLDGVGAEPLPIRIDPDVRHPGGSEV